MLKKLLVGCGIGLFGLVTALPAVAQESATIVMRDGARQSGELVDLNASGFTLRVGGDERHIAKDDVAAIEFSAGDVPEAARARVQASQPVVVLRSGDVVDGRLTDIGGTHPLRLTVETSSGTKDYTSNDVARIYFHPVSTSASSTPSGSETPAGAIRVPANQQWTKTGVVVGRGQQVAFSAEGEVQLGNDNKSNPGGNAGATIPGMKYPVFNAPVGTLIARVGNSTPFVIGSNSAPIPMPTTGELQLGINDDNVADNSGAYAVKIEKK